MKENKEATTKDKNKLCFYSRHSLKVVIYLEVKTGKKNVRKKMARFEKCFGFGKMKTILLATKYQLM